MFLVWFSGIISIFSILVFSESRECLTAVTYSDSKSLFRLLKPAGNRFVSTGEILNPEFRISMDE